MAASTGSISSSIESVLCGPCRGLICFCSHISLYASSADDSTSTRDINNIDDDDNESQRNADRDIVLALRGGDQSSYQSSTQSSSSSSSLQYSRLVILDDDQVRHMKQLRYDDKSNDTSSTFVAPSSPSVYSSSTIGHHRNMCVPILIKLCSSTDAIAVAEQQYELIIRQRLENRLDLSTDTSMKAGSVVNRDVVETSSALSLLIDGSQRPHRRDDIRPHIRLLDDGRSALIVVDRGGHTIAELISNVFVSQSPSSPTPSFLPFSIEHIYKSVRFIRSLSRKLQYLHNEGVVHSSLCPSSVLLAVQSGDVQFLDLSSASTLATNRAKSNIDALATSDGWSSDIARYRAPEQSGKMNRPIDARTDLYSLGCILFECICGRPPFDSDDVIELIHKHLAQTAPSTIPSHVTSVSNPVLFEAMTVVDAIIGKLLAKEADERYQSAKGLDHDLEAVMDILRPIVTPTSSSSSSVPSVDVDSSIISSLRSLTPGSADQHSTFRLSSKLYGRDDDIAMLQRCYDACTSMVSMSTSTASTSTASTSSAIVCDNISICVSQLVLIAGTSGMGKTSLVDEFRSVGHHTQRGLLARSKFDLHRRDSSAMMNAFRHLLLYIQSMGAERSIWRDRLMTSMGADAAVICQAIPELIDIIGTQPSVSILDASDTAKRFDATFVQFVSALSTPSSPLTLFIDDLQWADSSSLSLLQLLVNQDEAHLLIIGAYRSNEVTSIHLLTKMINDIKSSHRDRVSEIKLSSLTSSHIQSLIVDSFQCDVATAAPLADLLLSRTLGCPFYVNTLLKLYYDSSLLKFDFGTSRWSWTIESLQSVPILDDAIDIICEQMAKLSSSSQSILQYASCIGHTFTFASLLVVTQMNESDLAKAVCELEHAGLVRCAAVDARRLVVMSQHHNRSTSEVREYHHKESESIEHRMASSATSSYASTDTHHSTLRGPSSSRVVINITFAHDKIQSAAVKLIPMDRLSILHCNIAKRMLTSYTKDDRKANAIDIVYHINDFAFDNNESSTIRGSSDGSIQHMDIDYHASSGSINNISASDDIIVDVASHWMSLLSIGGIDSADGMLSSIIELEMIAIDASIKSNAPKAVIRLVECALMLIRIRCHHGKVNSDDLRDHRTTAVELASAAPSSSSSSSSSAECRFIRLSSKCWQSQYRHCISLYLSLSQSLYIDCEYRQSQLVTEYALSFIADIDDRSSYYDLHIQSLLALQKMNDALSIGLSYLMSLDIDLSLPASPDLITWIESWPDVNDDSTYMQHPVFALPEQPISIEMRLLATMASVCYFVQSPLIGGCPTAILQLAIDKGRSNAQINWSRLQLSVDGCSTHRACVNTSNIILTYAGGERPTSEMNALVLSSISFLQPWSTPFNSMIGEAEVRLVEAIGYNKSELSLIVSELNFVSGAPLSVVIPRIDHHIALVTDKKMSLPLSICKCWHRLCRLLSDESYIGAMIDHAVPIAHVADLLTCGIHQFIMRRCDDAVLTLNQAWSMRMSIDGCISQSALVYYRCLALLSNCTSATITVGIDSIVTNLPPSYDAALVDARLAEADALIAQMYIWSKSCPANFEHKYMLMLAERHRVSIFSHISNHTLILPCLQLYVHSFQLARENNQLLDAATAEECRARFHSAANQLIAQRTHIMSAHSIYTAYGATVKCVQLRDEYPNEFNEPKSNSTDQNVSNQSSHDASPSSRTTGTMMDDAVEDVTHNNTVLGVDLSLSSSTSTPLRSHTPSSAGSNSDHGIVDSPLRHSSFDIVVHRPDLSRSSHSHPSPSMHSRSRSTITQSITNFVHRSTSLESNLSTPPSDRLSCIDNRTPASSPTRTTCDAAVPNVGVHSLDAISILKMTSTLAQETDHTVLPARLMKMIIQAAAATRGTLVLKNVDNDEWNVECAANVDGTHTATASLHRLSTSSTSDESSTLLPLSIFRDCISTSKPILLPLSLSVSAVCPYINDRYFHSRSTPPRSLLAIPLIKASIIFGVLFVENDHQRSFFNSSHIELLQLLCSQAALCIDNIRLYSKLSTHNIDLEQLVQQRTMELEERNGQLTISIARAEAATKSAEDATLVAESAMKRAEEATVRAENATKDAERATAVAESATKVKATFLANMSHEIRTPMNAVLGAGQLLSSTDLSIEQIEYVGMINSSGHLLLNIINDILDFSKIEAGGVRIDLEPHNVLDICDTAAELVRDMAMSRGLHSNGRFIDPSIPRLLMLDTMRLQQVLTNLLSNAIKFTKPPGSIVWRVTGRYLTPASVESSSTSSYSSSSSSSSSSSTSPHPRLYELSFSVTDTGVGITRESLSKLFNSFSQVAHSSGSNYGGTGLGLVIASKLVQAMNDAVKVEGDDVSTTTMPSPSITCVSEVGVGSTFAFKIRCTVPPDDIAPTSSSMGDHVELSSRDHTALLSSSQSSSSTMMMNDASSSSPPAASPIRRCIYGLTDVDRSTLKQQHILFIARDDPASRVMIELLRCMCRSVNTCTSIESAKAYVNDSEASTIANNDRSTNASPQRKRAKTAIPMMHQESDQMDDVSVSSMDDIGIDDDDMPTIHSPRVSMAIIDMQSPSSVASYMRDQRFDILDSLPTLFLQRMRVHTSPRSLPIPSSESSRQSSASSLWHSSSSSSSVSSSSLSSSLAPMPLTSVLHLAPSVSIDASSLLRCHGCMNTTIDDHTPQLPLTPAVSAASSPPSSSPSNIDVQPAHCVLTKPYSYQLLFARILMLASIAAPHMPTSRVPHALKRQSNQSIATLSTHSYSSIASSTLTLTAAFNGKRRRSSSCIETAFRIRIEDSTDAIMSAASATSRTSTTATYSSLSHSTSDTSLSSSLPSSSSICDLLSSTSSLSSQSLIPLLPASCERRRSTSCKSETMCTSDDMTSHGSPSLSSHKTIPVLSIQLSAVDSISMSNMCLTSLSSSFASLAHSSSSSTSSPSTYIITTPPPSSSPNDVSSSPSLSSNTPTSSPSTSLSSSSSRSLVLPSPLSSRSSRSSSSSSSTTSSSSSSSSSSSYTRLINIASTHPLRVLLAEDNLINQKMMIMMMRKLGYTIMTAINGVEALAVIEREAARGPQYEIECILMDASMDIMDGMECTRRIRQEQRPDRVRPYIIAQTANVTEEYRVACMEADMDVFLCKYQCKIDDATIDMVRVIAMPIIVTALVASLKSAYADHHSS